MRYYKVPDYQVEVTKDGKHIINSFNKKVKTQYTDKDGYKYISISTDNGKKTFKKVHILVALTFCKGYKKGLEVNHKNLIKDDNHYKNLEWTTHKKNMQHAIRKKGFWQAFGEKNGRAKVTRKKVKWIRKEYAKGNRTQRDIGNEVGLHNTVISNIINYKNWK